MYNLRQDIQLKRVSNSVSLDLRCVFTDCCDNFKMCVITVNKEVYSLSYTLLFMCNKYLSLPYS